MNIAYSDRLNAAGTLTGSNFAINGKPRYWAYIYAHEDSTVSVTSPTMTLNDGTTPLSTNQVDIVAGSYYLGYFSEITLISGDVTCGRQNAD